MNIISRCITLVTSTHRTAKHHMLACACASQVGVASFTSSEKSSTLCQQLPYAQPAQRHVGIKQQQPHALRYPYPYELQEDVQVAILSQRADILHDVGVPEATEQLHLQAERQALGSTSMQSGPLQLP